MEKRDYEGALYYLMTETVAYNDNKLIPLAKQALDDLQELVKRNEPMKVLIKDGKFGHYDFFCPSCKEFVGLGNSVRESLTLNYCPHCGQKLDWSNDK